MNNDTYTLKSATESTITIEFTIEGKKVTEVLDRRYVPTEDADSFKAYCENYITAYRAGLEAAAARPAGAPEALAALVNKPQAVTEVPTA